MRYFNPTRQCLIDGIIVDYDACTTNSKESGDKLYGNSYNYIGSSYTYYIDGTKNVSIDLHHFYKLK